jgi:hypothetical protein
MVCKAARALARALARVVNRSGSPGRALFDQGYWQPGEMNNLAGDRSHDQVA